MVKAKRGKRIRVTLWLRITIFVSRRKGSCAYQSPHPVFTCGIKRWVYHHERSGLARGQSVSSAEWDHGFSNRRPQSGAHSHRNILIDARQSFVWTRRDPKIPCDDGDRPCADQEPEWLAKLGCMRGGDPRPRSTPRGTICTEHSIPSVIRP